MPRKHALARTLVAEIVEPLLGSDTEGCCVLLAGDIVYDMAHDAPRPERSTGKLVNGSDLDLVFIVADDLPEGQVAELDQAILRRKHRLLRDPVSPEEIDYIVKRLERVREQVAFTSSSAWLPPRSSTRVCSSTAAKPCSPRPSRC